MIKNFNHACIIVKNLERSLKFYRDLLGLKVSKRLAVEGEYPEAVLNIKGLKLTYVKLRCQGQPKHTPPNLELHCWKKPKISPKKTYNHISLTVKDLDRAYKRMRKNGVRFISKPVTAPYGYSKICFGYDPDDNLIEFVEELRK